MNSDLQTIIQEQKTFSQAEFDVFAQLSGDDNPIHVDPEFSARTRFGRTVAHGMLLYSVLCGAISRHFPGAVQLSQELMFPAPTYADEPMTIHLELLAKEGQQLRLLTEMRNPAGETTLTGETVIFIMTEANELVLLDFEGTTAVVTLNRPQRHNSLVPALLREMLAVLAEVATDESVRALVLQANGRSFSTGGDALGFVQHADAMEPYAREIVGLLNQVILALIDLPVPVITAVHGIVTGGSLGFILGSDIVLVAPEASFAPFYSEVGPSPDGGWAGLLPLVIGPRRAAEVLYLNEAIGAETAVTWGLANRVVAADQIQAEALAIAKAIAAKKQGSIRHTKQLLHLDHAEIAARLDAELDHFVQQMVTPEAIDGFRDFVNQRRKAVVA